MNRIEKLMEFLKNMPDDSFLKHALSLEYIKAGDDVAAASLFRELLEKDPGYVGSYYHLGKLLERSGENAEAIVVYEKGMEVAKKNNDRHSYSELQAAKEELED